MTIRVVKRVRSEGGVPVNCSIILQVLMPVEEYVEVVFVDFWQEMVDDGLEVLVVQTEHWVVHRGGFPNNITPIPRLIQNLINPIRLFITFLHKRPVIIDTP